MRLDTYHFLLWARLAREVVHIGYYRTQPFYTPPPAGKIWDGEIEYATDADIEIAERIGHAVAALRQVEETLAEVLKQFYGAYGEPPPRADRLRRLHMPRQRVHELRKRAEAWVEGHLSSDAP